MNVVTGRVSDDLRSHIRRDSGDAIADAFDALRADEIAHMLTLRACAKLTDEQRPVVTSRPARCSRCGGAGGSDAWRFTGRTCYRCAGNGADPVSRDYTVTSTEFDVAFVALVVKVLERRHRADVKRAAKAAEKHATKQAAIAASLATLIADTPTIADAIGRGSGFTGYGRGVLDSIVERGTATDNQIDAVARALTEHDEAVAQAVADAMLTHFGCIGDRVNDIDATVDAVIIYEGRDYMTGNACSKAIIKFRVDDAVLVWFTDHSHRLSDGDAVTMAATIKDHDVRDGVKQTIVTRCTVVRTPTDDERIAIERILSNAAAHADAGEWDECEYLLRTAEYDGATRAQTKKIRKQMTAATERA